MLSRYRAAIALHHFKYLATHAVAACVKIGLTQVFWLQNIQVQITIANMPKPDNLKIVLFFRHYFFYFMQKRRKLCHAHSDIVFIR